MIPEAKLYIEKRERKTLLSEANFEMKELSKRVRFEEDVGTYTDDCDGLDSQINYVAMEDKKLQEDFVDEANNTVPYSKQKRDHGEGELRLGKSVSLAENIYTLAFISEIRNEEIDFYTQED